MVTDTIIPQCGARVRTIAGEFHETPVWCATTVGLTEYQDVHGVTRWYCRHHEKVVKFRYPRAKPLEACWFCFRTGPVVDGRYTLLTLEDGRLRVCCDDCYVKADEPEEDDEPEWSNPEGDPTRNGAFA